MRITHPTGRTVVLLSPAGEEYDARLPSPAVAPRPATVWGDVFGVVPLNARMIWSWDFGTGAIPGYVTLAGSASLAREAPTTASNDAQHTYNGSPILVYNSGATANSTLSLHSRVHVPITSGATYYLANVFNIVGGAAGDQVYFILYLQTSTRTYQFGIRFVTGTGWQVLNGAGAYETLTGTPTSYDARDWVPILLVVNTMPQYVSLHAGGLSWGLTDVTVYTTSGIATPRFWINLAATNTTTTPLTVRFAQLTLYQT